MGDKKRKDWEDSPSTATPITAVELERVEARVRDLRWDCPAAWTSVDEFDNDSIDGAWTRVDGTGAPSGNVVWTEGSDVLSMLHTGTDTGTAFHGLVRALSGAGGTLVTGDAFITAFRLFGSPNVDYTMGGLCLSDGTTHGSGNQVMAVSFNNQDDIRGAHAVFPFTSWTTSGTSSAVLGSGFDGLFYQRLVMTAANTWRLDVSPDGVSWMVGTAVSKTITPTHVGFACSSFGTANTFVLPFEFLRRVSGVS